MKLYLFYLIDTEIINKYIKYKWIEPKHEINPEKPFLYAYTSSKNLANKFELSRNMKVFMKHVANINDEDEYEQTLDKRGQIVEVPLENGNGKTIVPVTENEFWFLDRSSETMFDYLRQIITPIPTAIFCDEVRWFLHQISFPYVVGEENEEFFEIEGREDIPMKEFQNEFGVFLYIFEDIIDPAGVEEVATYVKAS